MFTREHVLFQANWTKLYRYTGFADYYIHNVESKTTVPLAADQAGGKHRTIFLILSKS